MKVYLLVTEYYDSRTNHIVSHGERVFGDTSNLVEWCDYYRSEVFNWEPHNSVLTKYYDGWYREDDLTGDYRVSYIKEKQVR